MMMISSSVIKITSSCTWMPPHARIRSAQCLPAPPSFASGLVQYIASHVLFSLAPLSRPLRSFTPLITSYTIASIPWFIFSFSVFRYFAFKYIHCRCHKYAHSRARSPAPSITTPFSPHSHSRRAPSPSRRSPAAARPSAPSSRRCLARLLLHLYLTSQVLRSQIT